MSVATRRLLLACGALAALVYVGMNVAVPMLAEGYDVTSQAVSELSALGAPTRTIWLAIGTVYTILLILFGLGVTGVGRTRALRAAGVFLLLQGVLGFYWPPMQARGSQFATTDALHIAWTIATLAFMVTTIVFGAIALSKPFRIYSGLTVAVFLVFGTLTGMQGPALAANEPTPLLGVWERTNIGAYMLWLFVFSLTLLRGEKES